MVKGVLLGTTAIVLAGGIGVVGCGVMVRVAVGVAVGTVGVIDGVDDGVTGVAQATGVAPLLLASGCRLMIGYIQLRL